MPVSSQSQLITSEHTTKPSDVRQVAPRNSGQDSVITASEQTDIRGRSAENEWQTKNTGNTNDGKTVMKISGRKNDEIISDGLYIHIQSSRLRAYRDSVWQTWHWGKKSACRYNCSVVAFYCFIILSFWIQTLSLKFYVLIRFKKSLALLMHYPLYPAMAKTNRLSSQSAVNWS